MKADRFSITRISNHILGRKKNGNQSIATFTITGENSTDGNAVDFDHQADSSIGSDCNGRRYSHFTREPLPRLEYYRTSKRGLKRPSIGELHGDLDRKSVSKETDDNPVAIGHGIKLGWIEGVLIPCLLNIWGVMLFLRLSWVVSQAGIIQTLIIIGVSYLVCVITATSLSAICTNGQVKGGGIYYLISRSLGPEFGASVGIVFAFANSVQASLNTIGFCNSLNDLLKSFGVKIVDGGVNDVRIVGTVAIIVMVIVCAVGMEWEAKAQNFLIVTIVIAIFNFLIGVSFGPQNSEEVARGFMGFSMDVFKANLKPDYRYSENMDQSFFTVFAIFFPSVTGVQAGANICGDLKDPATAIPKGTLLALVISAISYVTFVFFAGAAAVRDASGNVTDLLNETFASCAVENNCSYGLHNDYTAMQLMSISSAVIYAGCFAATLSTALTNLLSVPRIIQALGIDRIYPGLIFFSRGYGKHGEPYRGYALVLVVSVLFVLIADINAIAPLISNFYLASYALINFCTFHAATVKPLGWRPTFRFYHPWLSLVGSILCIAIMFQLAYTFTIITIVVIFILYLIVIYRKPDVNWGSSTQEQTYKSALSSTLKLQTIGDHVKNYHPSILVLAGNPMNRPPLIDLANLITKNHSLMIVGDIIKERLSHRKRQELTSECTKFLEVRKIRGFYQPIDGLSFEEGVHALIQTSGVGKLSPNIVLMGYKSDWMSCPVKDLLTYYNVLHDSFDCRMALAILRLPNGLDFSHLNTEIVSSPGGLPDFSGSHINLQTISTIIADDGLTVPQKLMHVDSNFSLDLLAGSNNTTPTTTSQQPPIPNQYKVQESRDSIIYSTRGGSCVPKEILDRLGIFQRKQPKGTIDVWWLYDDGGLTMLVPYIISMRSKWSRCKIRVFALTNRQMDLEAEERNMANLLMKLRIDYSSLTMLQGVMDHPHPDTVCMHNHLLQHFTENDGTQIPISENERLALQEKTNRQLRLREMVLEYSNSANLIVMSMPMPRLGTVSAPLYMSWLEMLTKDMPPFLLVRGNQTSVLTFYS
ncbi:bumetanide-sensitive sodium-(potassium)-chloride cotransporter-like isoform X2 [Toxorhynchites rutilus septentrionalis]|uniref:bumetanide-sensitive sodium-(potassium)-chloride cotransporter-like isoform X2 n=1 Tax=Toxorhynchites rutilus septentrionalis TaxID=329112 RepID=UPI0024788D8D|nr:bumetanide-sensitive sodium-(potassium)-chloride cotransporter-like isoform X2 [Toxorhynchites rutilus septentrionalis]